jgi:hypothetical protein
VVTPLGRPSATESMAAIKQQNTTPSSVALCVKLARRNHAAGVLLHRIFSWAKYAKAKIPKSAGTWNANDRDWWMCEAQLSADQFDRAIRKLENWKLIERRQWWFGGRNILHVRPTPVTFNYLQCAKTWAAAEEFLEDALAVDEKTVGKIAEPSSGELLNFNKSSKDAEPGTAKLQNSNNNKNLLSHSNETLIAYPASPIGAKEALSYKSPEGEQEGGKGGDGPTLKQLAHLWTVCLNQYWHVSAKLSPKELGFLAELVKGCSTIISPNGPEDLTKHVPDIIWYSVTHWAQLGPAKKFPEMEWLGEHLGEAIKAWHQAGRPPIKGIPPWQKH